MGARSGSVAPGYGGLASVLDVAPTIAYLLGLPVANDLPGRVLVESFTTDRLTMPPIERVPAW